MITNFTKATILRHIKTSKLITRAVTIIISIFACMCLMGVSGHNEVSGEIHEHLQRNVIAGFELIPETTTAMHTTSTVTTCTTATTETAVTTTETVTTTTTATTTNTSTTTIETTTDETTTVAVETVVETEATDNIVEEPIMDVEEYREYVVYKPSTHYIHMNTCRWFNAECYEISSTEGLECRRCSECNPDMDIISEYVIVQQQQPVAEPVDCVQNTSGHTALNYVTETEFIYLCNTVGHEYGSDTHGYGGAPVTLYERACVVASVMNRVNDGGWTNGKESNIYNVLTAPHQFNPSYASDYYHSCVTQSCIDSVDYYFEHQSEFPHYTSFWGDGKYNHFR